MIIMMVTMKVITIMIVIVTMIIMNILFDIKTINILLLQSVLLLTDSDVDDNSLNHYVLSSFIYIYEEKGRQTERKINL